MLGDGELRSKLEEKVETLRLKEKVLMPGFKQYDELPYYYTLAKAFIHASTSEQWGLVVNEAMACGLPILISNRCGSAEDLVKSEVNGLAFDPYSVSDIAEKMTLLSSGKFNLATMSEKSLNTIADFTPNHFANNLVLAANKALENKKKNATLLSSFLLNYFIQK